MTDVGRAHNWPHRLRTIVGPIAIALVFIAAFLVLRRSIHHITLDEVLAEWRQMPRTAILLAIGLTALNYWLLTLYDVLGLRYVGASLPYPRIAAISFSAFAIGHNLGVPSLSGGTIRYRAYSLAGLSTVQIATVIGFVSMTFGMGAALLVGVSLIFEPVASMQVLGLPPFVLRGIGVALLSIPMLYLLWTALSRHPLRIRDWTLTTPTTATASSQLLLAVVDLSLLATIFYVLLPPQLGVDYFVLLGAFLVAMGAGALSNVPGGLGVFESVLVLLLHSKPTASLLGTLLAFRLIYYIVPLVLALVLIVGETLATHADRLRHVTRVGGGWLRGLAPQAAGMVVFLSGAALVIGNSLPIAPERLALLNELVPLAVLELSHTVSAAIGVALLIVSRGLFRRLHSAYQTTMLLMVSAFALSFVKGLAIEYAVIVAFTALVLWLARGEFYRGAKLLDQSFTIGWLLSFGMVITGGVILGLFAYRDVEYSHALWWQFELNADAPRMLRASLMGVVILTMLGLARLLRPAPLDTPTPTDQDMARVNEIVAASTATIANVALLGDKRFLFHPSGDAFIMFQASGRSWIALSGPIGNPDHFEELVWQFREATDRHDARCVFYLVSNSDVPMYLELGLSLIKLGEEARVRLENFSLDGHERAELRHVRNRATRAGASFDVVAAADVPALMGELKAVSDNWLTHKNVHEKGFSLGAFIPSYVALFDCAVVRVHGSLVAFATIWKGANSEELTVDLMRFTDQAPNGVMDYLFTEMLLLAKAQGYRWFSLGMAPLSGLDQHELATQWNKLGNLLYRFGENFYNFEGLRRYKSKFLPEWEPRYLASPGGFGLTAVLIDTTVLISGGVREVFTK
ncbi:MAG TPA: bifunctional lysylphosphatidylglycerol flippase/synthetase MprF [Pseudomonadales bacterium]